ncbi:hypothetical protein BH20ACI1_BH20ACI1_20530 [soil metagenome]
MSQTFTAIIKQGGDWWIGWIEEISGVNSQEKRAMNCSNR